MELAVLEKLDFQEILLVNVVGEESVTCTLPFTKQFIFSQLTLKTIKKTYWNKTRTKMRKIVEQILEAIGDE